jgi:hypothetical protein
MTNSVQKINSQLGSSDCYLREHTFVDPNSAQVTTNYFNEPFTAQWMSYILSIVSSYSA